MSRKKIITITHSLNLKFESKELTVKIKEIGKINSLNIKFQNSKFQKNPKFEIPNSKFKDNPKLRIC